MMQVLTRLMLVTLCLSLLTGCVSRETADAQLAKGCEAGVKAMLPEGYEMEVKGTAFSPSPVGPDYRHVTLKAIEHDGWLEEEKEYSCIFQEEFGFARMSHTAALYQLDTGHNVYGKSGKEILGDAQDFLKLIDAVRAAMY